MLVTFDGTKTSKKPMPPLTGEYPVGKLKTGIGSVLKARKLVAPAGAGKPVTLVVRIAVLHAPGPEVPGPVVVQLVCPVAPGLLPLALLYREFNVTPGYTEPAKSSSTTESGDVAGGWVKGAETEKAMVASAGAATLSRHTLAIASET